MKKGGVPSTVLVFLLFVIGTLIIFALIMWAKGKYDLGLKAFWEIIGGGKPSLG